MRLVLVFVLLLTGAWGSQAQTTERSRVTAITGGNVVDVNSGTSVRNAVMLIEGAERVHFCSDRCRDQYRARVR